MRYYTTQLLAIDPTDGEVKLWQGPNIPAISLRDAENYCQNNGFGYLQVIGLLVEEIGTKIEDGFIVADMKKITDYEKTRQN